MAAIFPSEEWLKELETKLNADKRYREIAKNWEGDLLFQIEPEGNLKERITLYLDLRHGKCRKVDFNPQASSHLKPAYTLTASYNNLTDILTGKINPMTAMMTKKLTVQGNMSYLMRNVPVVLDFVRVANEVTKEIL